MTKKLKINCAVCDARQVREKKLSAYEQIIINAATVLESAESHDLMSAYPVKLNCANVISVGDNAQVAIKTFNGSTQIHAADCSDERSILLVNGKLTIERGAEEALKQYLGIVVNGSVLCPESVRAASATIHVNGEMRYYPDDAVILKNNACIDRTFALRAKNKLYWAAKRLIMVDPALEPEALAVKGATFSAGEAIVAESKVEAISALLDERTDILIVPDGTAVVKDDVELSDGVIRRYGTKLFVLGDLRIPEPAEPALDALEYLRVEGDVSVARALRDKLIARTEEISGEIRVLRGRELHGLPLAWISGQMLSREPDGITVIDCAKVTLGTDVSEEQILNKLSIQDCACVSCTPEQKDAVSVICQDVVHIFSGKDEDDRKSETDGDDVQTINAVEYVL